MNEFDLNAMASAMMGLMEAMKPVYEAAQGIKAEMIGQGYTEEQATATAAEFIQGMIHMILKGRS